MKAGTRRRSVGVRDRIISRLSTFGEISDPAGLASTVLADEVGYSGSSAAFAQLLSGMERAGLIDRQIRGKRTYRIRLAGDTVTPTADAQLTRRARPPVAATSVHAAGLSTPARLTGQEPPSDPQADGIDYDALARRLLVQVVQRLTVVPTDDMTSGTGQSPAASDHQPEPRQADLARTVARLERKLATTQSRQRKLSEENARLREQLAAAQQSLTEMQGAASRGRPLDTAETQVLERLLSALNAGPDLRDSAEAG